MSHTLLSLRLQYYKVLTTFWITFSVAIGIVIRLIEATFIEVIIYQILLYILVITVSLGKQLVSIKIKLNSDKQKIRISL